jgi:glycerol-3-phosphate acyltransferase PlsY
MSIFVIIAIAAYLLGSIPFGYILVRAFTGADIRQTGSGNIGATNVARSGRKGLAIATLAFDAAKGFLAVYLVRFVVTGSAERVYLAASIAALCAIAGHMFPVWLKFRGGKGVATGVGAFIALAPWAVLVTLTIFVALVVVSRYVSLGSIVAAAAFPVFVYVLYHNDPAKAMLPAIVIASALIIYRHKANIRRLLSGTEHRFGAKTQ